MVAAAATTTLVVMILILTSSCDDGDVIPTYPHPIPDSIALLWRPPGHPRYHCMVPGCSATFASSGGPINFHVAKHHAGKTPVTVTKPKPLSELKGKERKREWQRRARAKAKLRDVDQYPKEGE